MASEFGFNFRMSHLLQIISVIGGSVLLTFAGEAVIFLYRFIFRCISSRDRESFVYLGLN